MKIPLEEKYKDKIIKLITALQPNAKIYLFGSRARLTHRDTSDIDLAIDTGALLPSDERGELRDVLEGTNIPYKIDIVDIHLLSEQMLASTKREGIIWKS